MEKINIKKENKIIMTVGLRYTLGYDNFQWGRLAEIIDALEKGTINKLDYLNVLSSDGAECVEAIIDLDNKTITNIPSFPLFDFEEVNKDNCCIDLLRREDGFYAQYEDEEVYMSDVVFNEDLLRKTTYTFDDIKKISNFVTDLTENGGLTDFILNNKCVIRLNNI